MKKFFAFALVLATASFIACGPSAEEQAAAEKAKADSIAAAAAADSAAKAAAAAAAEAAKTATVVAVAQNDPELSTLASLIQEAGLVDALVAAGPFTVLAPTNDAFAKVPAQALEALKADKEKLAAVLKLHVVAAAADAATVQGLKEVETLAGKKQKVVAKDGKVSIGGANVTAADIKAGNGLVHKIDAVILK